MLDEFLSAHRDEILSRTRARVSSRISPAVSTDELLNGIPRFLDQLGDALRLARESGAVDNDRLAETAASHGRDLLRMGLTIAQVVHDYGDVCQVLTELAVERRAAVLPEEFRTLNLCLDDAIAGAVTEYARGREAKIARDETERLGMLVHELRSHLNSALLSFEIIKSGRVSAGGSTGMVHAQSLMGLRDLIDRSLTLVRLDASLKHPERLAVADVIEELELGALLQAKSLEVRFGVSTVDRTILVEADRQLLVAAVSNLLQNAFKFTKKRSRVSLGVRATEDRVLFEVEDECGGLPPRARDFLFRPFEQAGRDRSGLGLGLPICRLAAERNGGHLGVRDIPGKGCVFTLDLPRVTLPPSVRSVARPKLSAVKPQTPESARSRRGRPPKAGVG